MEMKSDAQGAPQGGWAAAVGFGEAGSAEAGVELSVVSEADREIRHKQSHKRKSGARKVIERFSQSALQILTLLVGDAHLETKGSDDGKPSRSELNEANPSGTSDESAAPLMPRI
jgi:hypothetical protein